MNTVDLVIEPCRSRASSTERGKYGFLNNEYEYEYYSIYRWKIATNNLFSIFHKINWQKESSIVCRIFENPSSMNYIIYPYEKSIAYRNL
jgi:hypothetical protein